MHQTDNSKIENSVDSGIDEWFNTIIGRLKADHFLMKENLASNETKNLYSILMGDQENIISTTRQQSSQYFIEKILIEYLTEIKGSGKIPIQIAMGITESKLLVWSKIEDDDEEMENLLLLTEAKINGKYHKNGFYINSTIIERSDNIPVPLHYKSLN